MESKAEAAPSGSLKIYECRDLGIRGINLTVGLCNIFARHHRLLNVRKKRSSYRRRNKFKAACKFFGEPLNLLIGQRLPEKYHIRTGNRPQLPQRGGIWIWVNL